jgi:predicted alpha/beta superfamily hydrolase
MYQTTTTQRRDLHVHYPAGRGRILMRTELDWERDLEPAAVSEDGTVSTFTLEAKQPFLYFKACLKTPAGGVRWTVGPNMLALMTTDDAANVYPYFEGSDRGSFLPLVTLPSKILGREHKLRAYLPAGYAENPLRRFPVFYMQDGKNLFFPDEAFGGQDWGVDEVLTLLDTMNVVDRVVIVGIHSGDRMAEYTKPGYEAYARSVVEEVKPVVDAKIRSLDTPRERAVIGSSLGGVVSFYMAWQYPEVFGYAACMSSTFSHKDDLTERVLSEPKSRARFYLDSGWPGDNYEVTLAMAMAFVERGYRVREDFLHLAFPLEEHDEKAWGRRIHLPLQLALGQPGVTARRRIV